MANYYGVNATKAAAGFIGENIINQGYNGKETVLYDEYEADALANASTITLFEKLPVGAVVTEMQMMNDDMGSTVTVKVGDAGDDDRYIVATSVTTANTKTDMNNIAGFGYKITGTDDTQVIATVAGVLTGTLKFIVKYVL